MKLSILIIFLTASQVKATKLFSQNITASFEQVELRTVLNAIEKKAKVRFLYNYDLSCLTKKVDFSVKNAKVSDALNKLLENSGLQYREMENNLIVISSEKTGETVYQTRATVTGVVTDDKNQPLPGVSINVKGTSLGTTTNAEGRYTLNVPSANDILLFTYIGFTPQEQALSGKTTLNVTLVALPLNSSADAQLVTNSLLSKNIDAFFANPDNTVFASFETILKSCNQANVPIFTSEAGLVQRGAVAAFGADIYQWGYQSGEQAAQYLKTHKTDGLKPEMVKIRKRVYNAAAAQKYHISVPENFEAVK